MYELPTITVSGSPRAMGQAHGEARRAGIQAFVNLRLRAARAYLFERGDRDPERLLAAARDCLALHAAWHPAGIEEHRGIAAAADVDPVELYATTNMTDLRDLVLYPSAEADSEGCTSLLLPPSATRDGVVLAAQTWDLNPGDLDHVVAIHRRPADGPETWSVTCEGSLSLVGMNGSGLWVGTTNIKVADTRPGIPYLGLLHRALEEDRWEAAAELLSGAPRAAAHTYWFADARGGTVLECSARRCARRDLDGDEALVQTNHCLDPEHCALQAEAPGSSSAARLARARAICARGDHDVDSIRALFSDRSDGVDSISRHPEDAQGTATNSCLIAIPARRELHACRGPADRGRWQRLCFAG